MSDILLIGSCEPYSGKSALVLGIAKAFTGEKTSTHWETISNMYRTY